MKTVRQILMVIGLFAALRVAGADPTHPADRLQNKAGGAAAYTIVFDGNSWVAGSGSTGGSNFPAQVAALLQKKGKKVDLLNFGIPGQTIDQMMAGVAAKVDIHHEKYQYLVGLELVNQWGRSSQSREEIYAKYKQYFLDRKKAGFRKVIALTPIAQSYYNRADWEKDRQWFIKQMLAEFPRLGIQVANVGADPKLSDPQNKTYFTRDQIHPTNAGYEVIAGIVYKTLIDLK